MVQQNFELCMSVLYKNLTNKLPVGDVGCCAQQSDQSEVVVHLWCPEMQVTEIESQELFCHVSPSTSSS